MPDGHSSLTESRLLQVYHIDFCTSEFKYAVFRSIPFGSAAHAVVTKLVGRNPEGPMANVVADPHKLGYGKLYVLFLEHAKLSILRAFRLLGKDENYPMMVHCIHGCVPASTLHLRLQCGCMGSAVCCPGSDASCLPSASSMQQRSHRSRMTFPAVSTPAQHAIALGAQGPR